jgi:hypothetical protein
MIVSQLNFSNVNARRFQTKQNPTGPQKLLNNHRKRTFYQISNPQLVGEQVPSCHYLLWNSRKIFKKVTNALFPNKINGIFAPALARRPLIRRGEQVFRENFFTGKERPCRVKSARSGQR